MIDRFAGDLLNDEAILELLVTKMFSIPSDVGAIFYFHDHRFAVIKVRKSLTCSIYSIIDHLS